MVVQATPQGARLRTPDASRVRLAVLGPVLVGGSLGFSAAALPQLAARFHFAPLDAGLWFGSNLLGFLIAIGLWTAIRIAWLKGVAGYWLSALSVGIAAAALSWAYEPPWIFAAGCLLGASAGVAAARAVRALDEISRFHGGATVAPMAAAGLCIGAAGAAGALAIARSLLTFDLAMAAAAGVALLVGGAIVRTGSVVTSGSEPLAVEAAGSRSRQSVGALIYVGLLLQAATYGLLGGWTAIYAQRVLGLTPVAAAAVLSSWCVAATVSSCAVRNGLRARSLAAVAGLFVVGGLFLLYTTSASGAWVGAVILGLASGALQSASRELFRTSEAPNRSGSAKLLPAVVGAGLAAAAVAGPLAARLGMQAVVWAGMACGAAACLSLAITAAEVRLGRRAA